MGYNRLLSMMKKYLMIIICAMMALLSYADNYGSCKVDKVSGAYVYAEIYNVDAQTVSIHVNAYIVKEGAVNVVFTWEDGDKNSHREDTVVHFSNGKAQVPYRLSTKSSNGGPYITSVRVYNPICK